MKELFVIVIMHNTPNVPRRVRYTFQETVNSADNKKHLLKLFHFVFLDFTANHELKEFICTGMLPPRR